ACYNTANISGGDHYIGGISGNSTSTISSCYSIGAVSGNGVSIGGICGRISGSGSVTACYWKDIPGDKAAYGTGSSSSNAGAGIFAAGVWPSSAEWGSSNWKTLGSWNDGNPVYPRLAFED
ncbi:MAG: hypothetical protein LBK58_03420, partial [Prevotellaceae bacterium]|nr:hypothetical protein [Prevotellaceae bacterium]